MPIKLKNNIGLVSFVLEELVNTLLAFYLTLFNSGFDIEKNELDCICFY